MVERSGHLRDLSITPLALCPAVSPRKILSVSQSPGAPSILRAAHHLQNLQALNTARPRTTGNLVRASLIMRVECLDAVSLVCRLPPASCPLPIRGIPLPESARI